MTKANFILCTVAILVLGLSFSGCRTKPPGEKESESAGDILPSSITLTPESIKTAGIQTAQTEIRPVIKAIHAPGEVTFNPKRINHVTARAAGRIEQILAYPNDRVQKDQLVLSLYSQDFLSLQAELLQAAERSRRLHNEETERTAAQSLLDSARSKLRLLDITEAELDEIEKTGSIKPFLRVRAPLSGSIIESPVTAGDYVELGASFFRIADLSTVWVDIHIYEKDLSAVRTGCEVILRSAAYPGREFRGRIFQFGNVVDEKTRTVEGWTELPNPANELKPGMYVNAEIVSPAEAKSLFVPRAAVQDFQNRKVVFVRTGENAFTLREVETGISLDGYAEILKGLNEQEVIVTSGSFFLKSELLKKTLGEE